MRSSRFLSFSGGDRTSAHKSRRAKEHARGEQNVGKKWGGVSEKGEGGAKRKGIVGSESQTFYRTPFSHERGAIVQFDWLLARQSKDDSITRHPEHNKIKIDMAESEEAFEIVFEFFVQETSKDLSQNGRHIVQKPEQEAAIGV